MKDSKLNHYLVRNEHCVWGKIVFWTLIDISFESVMKENVNVSFIPSEFCNQNTRISLVKILSRPRDETWD